MSLDLPLLELKNFKRAFYYFLAFNFIVTVLSVVSIGLVEDAVPGKTFFTTYSWAILLVVMLGSFTYASKQKRELKTILAVADHREQLLKYEKH